jgi:hypothetical protein
MLWNLDVTITVIGVEQTKGKYWGNVENIVEQLAVTSHPKASVTP